MICSEFLRPSLHKSTSFISYYSFIIILTMWPWRSLRSLHYRSKNSIVWDFFMPYESISKWFFSAKLQFMIWILLSYFVLSQPSLKHSHPPALIFWPIKLMLWRLFEYIICHLSCLRTLILSAGFWLMAVLASFATTVALG